MLASSGVRKKSFRGVQDYARPRMGSGGGAEPPPPAGRRRIFENLQIDPLRKLRINAPSSLILQINFKSLR